MNRKGLERLIAEVQHRQCEPNDVEVGKTVPGAACNVSCIASSHRQPPMGLHHSPVRPSRESDSYESREMGSIYDATTRAANVPTKHAALSLMRSCRTSP